MRYILGGVITVGVIAAVAGCLNHGTVTQDEATMSPARQPLMPAGATVIPDDPAKVTPLAVGENAPAATLETPDGHSVDLAALYADKPTVLIFYRGGWCPFCNAHLAELSKIEPQLLELGYQILAISPDRPAELQKSIDKHHLNYQLLSDSSMKLTQSFGLAFRVDDPTVAKYHGFGIDLEKSSGRPHHLLPVPAVYIVDTSGRIRFAHYNPDYKTRLSGDQILTAAKAAATK